jgi:hypothetical protein
MVLLIQDLRANEHVESLVVRKPRLIRAMMVLGLHTLLHGEATAVERACADARIHSAHAHYIGGHPSSTDVQPYIELQVAKERREAVAQNHRGGAQLRCHQA